MIKKKPCRYTRWKKQGMISGRGGFTAKKSCTLFVSKSERKSREEWRRKRGHTGSKTDKRGTRIS